MEFIIFCSGVALVWTFNARGVYIFITEEANIGSILHWRLVPILSLFKVWINEWAKKYFSLKVEKRQSYLFQTGQNFAAYKTLVCSTYGWRTAALTIIFKKE